MAEPPDIRTNENYLVDIVKLLREGARRRWQRQIGECRVTCGGCLVHEGVALAHAAVLSTMQSQANIFGLRMREIVRTQWLRSHRRDLPADRPGRDAVRVSLPLSMLSIMTETSSMIFSC